MASAAFEDLFARARQALAAGKKTEARALYVQAAAANPESPDAHEGLATCCFLIGDLEQAEQHFQTAAELDPLRARVFINLGALANRRGRIDDAIAQLRKGLKLDPHCAEGFYNLGIAYRHKGLLDLAIEAYREATRVNPRMADAYLNLGNLLLEGERYHEAVAAYQHALEARPSFAKARAGLENAQKALATAPATQRVPASAPPADPVADAAPRPGDAFAGVLDRSAALDDLEAVCTKHEELCAEIVRVIEKELNRALHDLSRSLVGTPATGELEMHVDAYEKALGNLRTARQNMLAGMGKIRGLERRFAAAAVAEASAHPAG